MLGFSTKTPLFGPFSAEAPQDSANPAGEGGVIGYPAANFH